MSTRQVFITDVSVSLLCRFCMQIFEFEMKLKECKQRDRQLEEHQLRRREKKTFHRKMRRMRLVKNSRIDSQAEFPQVRSSRHNAR